MALKVEDVARHIAALTVTEEDVMLIGTWIDARWKELANAGQLRDLRRKGELYVEPPYTTGTVAATRGSRTVTGTGTAWSGELAGRYLRVKTVWHEIAAVASATSLELVSPYDDPDISEAGYNIIKRRHRLQPDVRKLGIFMHMRLRRPLHTVSEQGLDLSIPSRHSINSVPRWVAEVEADVDGVKRVEIYPNSNRPETIHYIYWIEPYTLGFDDPMPGFIDVEAMREGVMVDVLRYKMHKAMDAQQYEAAAIYRNEYRAQETRWLNIHRVRLLSQEQGTDDQEFILSREGAHPAYETDQVIDDAYKAVWYT